MVTVFNPSDSQLNDLATVLWSDLSTFSGLIDSLTKRLIVNPLDLLVSLVSVPVKPDIGDDVSVTFGGISFSQKVIMPLVTNQYKEFDCGTVNIPVHWGTYLDYSPYTRIQMWLPYVGAVSLDPDWVVGKDVNVKYEIDVVTGETGVKLTVANQVIYQFNGNCAIQIPLTGSDYSSRILSLLRVGATVAGGVATGLTGGLAAVGAASSSIVSSTVGAVMNSKSTFQMAGAIGSNAAVCLEQTPFVVISYPRLDLAENYRHYVGYPTNKTKQVSTCVGYTVFESVDLTNIPCTSDEKEMIDSILRGGFYV